MLTSWLISHVILGQPANSPFWCLGMCMRVHVYLRVQNLFVKVIFARVMTGMLEV